MHEFGNPGKELNFEGVIKKLDNKRLRQSTVLLKIMANSLFVSLNEVINRKKRTNKLTTTFVSNDKEISSPNEVANHFCEYFTNIGINLAKLKIYQILQFPTVLTYLAIMLIQCP